MPRYIAYMCVLMSATMIAAPQRRTSRPPAFKVSQDAKCPANLGTGIKSSRVFCDVLVADKAADGIVMTIPRHRGTSTLHFDLHNRFTVTPDAVQPVQAFARNAAVVAVLNPKNEIIGRGATMTEFRGAGDLFDRIAGGAGPGGVKAVAPGVPTPIDVTIAATLSSVSIVGVRVEVTNRLGAQTFDTPGRPVAIVSNLRIYYVPLR
jgi:hypothetical protein